ncbi:MAG: 2-C-methyl-D-erythritol 4-phosphate cytidylyltransferase [Verrucomicrobium sp.]|nr:2-C-methyl-D-erythritol 4-phosphate cytidylyltransferase [Verrucomicrobium sp.]
MAPAQGHGLGVVLAAAGSSRRLGFDKLFTPVLGKTVFQITLERILASPQVRQVVVVTSAGKEEAVAALLPADPAVPIRVIPGGAERQDSVAAGLAAVDPGLDYVMIQDGARPFLDAPLIDKVFAAAREHGAAVCGHPSIDTLKEANPDGTVSRTLDRAKVWAVQTPQIFSRSLLSEAYAAVKAAGQSVTDDTAAVEFLGRPVALVQNDGVNMKITRRADWEIGLPQFFPLADDVAAATELRKMAHDFSNQVTSILGFAYLLEADCPAESPLRAHVAGLADSVQKCHEITLRLQNFSRDLYARKAELQQSIEAPNQAPAAQS